MKKYPVEIVLFSLLLLVAGTVAALELPPPPNGYAWEECPEFGGALLVPDGWSFLRAEQDNRVGFFITKAPFQPPQTFETGLTFSMIRDVPAQAGIRPSEFSKRLIENAAAAANVERTWKNTTKNLQGHGVVYQGVGENEGFKFYTLVIANDKTGTAHLIVFESPLAAWESEWKVIEPVVQKMLIDDEY